MPDREDVILSIMELLRGTSLVNLRINEENREDIHGILQITFKNEKIVHMLRLLLKPIQIIMVIA